MDTRSPEPNEPNGLLAALVPFGVLRQPEVAVTTGIWWLLGLGGASRALDALVDRKGPKPRAGGIWTTEVHGEGGRTDLEYAWGDPLQTRVVVEAKLGHTLTPEQLAGYAGRLGDGEGLLVVLAPEARRVESDAVVTTCRELIPDPRIAFDVWTYDEVIAALDKALPGSADLAQFKGLVQAHRALDIYPFIDANLFENDPARRDDVWRVVDTASFGVGGTRWPAGSDGSLAYRRYVTAGPYDIGLAVGVGRKDPAIESGPRPWAWVRLSGAAGYSRVAQRALADLRPGEVWRDSGAAWLPLRIPTGVFGSVAIEAVRAEIETIAEAIRDAVDQAVEAKMASVAPEHRDSTLMVLEMQPIHPADLLDDSDARRDDIWLLLREGARGFYQGKLWPQVAGDSDYQLVRYIPVAPHDNTHVATCLGRKIRAESGGPQVWTWLRVHELTRHAEVGFQALEHLAPGRVVTDGHGRAIPLQIPVDADGPAMLAAVREQIHQAIARIRQAIRADSVERHTD